jgi:hypothetical protein
VDEFAPFPEWRHFVGSESDLIQILGAGPIGWVTVAMGLVGASVMVRSGSRIAAGLIVLTAGFALSIARLGSTWPPLMSVQADRVAPAIAAVLMIPAAFLVGRWWAAAAAGPAALTAATLLPLLLGWGGPLGEIGRVSLGLDCRPFRIGLTADQLTIVSSLKALTTSDARILVEDPEETPPGWNWTALLATLTDRPILGGLDPGACVEHVFCGLGSGKLNTRPFADWTPSERTAFVQRYNVGWVLCRTPAAADFWREEPTARELGRFRDGSEVILFQIDRPYSYILVGSAIVERIQRGRVVLTDVIPNSAGEVVLSLHHQPGLRAGPTGVTVDTDKDPFDPIPMIKLLIPGPVSRVALTWHNP